jgi:hypothetical protein
LVDVRKEALEKLKDLTSKFGKKTGGEEFDFDLDDLELSDDE